jgi:hypothetical protein
MLKGGAALRVYDQGVRRDPPRVKLRDDAPLWVEESVDGPAPREPPDLREGLWAVGANGEHLKALLFELFIEAI